MKLYHGSTYAVRKPSSLRGRANTDFGRGFYTTTSREQAEKWALIKKNRLGNTARAIVSCYDFDERLLNDDALRVMHFDGPTAQWLDFVVGNRRGAALHDYDLVMGPVANDKTLRHDSIVRTRHSFHLGDDRSTSDPRIVRSVVFPYERSQ